MAAPKDHMRNRIYAAERAFAQEHPEQVKTALHLESHLMGVVRRVPFKKMIAPRSCTKIYIERGGRICVPTVTVSGSEYWTIKVGNNDQATLLDVFHTMAHGILNVTLRNGWPGGLIHDVEFVKLYLDLVRRFYSDTADPAMMKEVKRHLIAQKVKTSTKSPEARAKARAAWHEKRTLPTVREQLLKMREELQAEVE